MHGATIKVKDTKFMSSRLYDGTKMRDRIIKEIWGNMLTELEIQQLLNISLVMQIRINTTEKGIKSKV